MGVETKCKEYDKNRPAWDLVRDAIDGEDTIKAKGTLYLPKPEGMEKEEYQSYAARVHWFNATGRTAKGLHGMVYSKPPILDNCPEALKKVLEDIDREGTNIDQFSSDLTWDALATNWGGVLVDYPQADEKLDKGSAEREGLRTYAAWYSAESIINLRKKTVNHQQIITLVVLHEPYEKIGSNEFSTEIKNRYRVLDLDEATGTYRQRIFDEDGDQGLSVPTSEVHPKKQGKELDYIPFFTFPGREPEKSMIFDLACENVGHYQKSADFENGLHLTGIPTPFATCQAPVDKNGDPVKVKLGGNSFLYLGDPAATADYLDFKGEGLSALEKAILNCEERMAILGARIISAEKKGVESASAARIHRAGENSVLASFALNASDVLTAVIREIGSWENISGSDKVTYKLNTEYDVEEMEAQLFSALTSAHVQNKIGRKVYFYNLKKNDRVPDDMDLEAFEKDIADSTEDHGPDGDDANSSAEGTDDEKNAKVGAAQK